MRTLLLTKEEVRSLVTMKEVIGAVEEAYRSFSAGQVIQPGYMGIHLPSPRGEIDFKAGYSTGMAIQDNTTAHLIYRNAVKGGVGTWFAFFE